MAPRHFEHWSDEALQQQALSNASEREAVLSEVLFRAREALNAQMRAANELARKIHGLNWALFWYTVGLGLMVAFQFGAWLRDFTR
jgi:hypothetical protein